MKKAFKIIGITLLVIIIALIAAPFLFESQLKDLVRKTINGNVNARVEFSDINLSMFRNFPQATLVIKDLSVVNNEPFAGDTLATGKEVILEMSVKELFKSASEPKSVDALTFNDAYVNIMVDSLGNANYDIAKETPADTTQSANSFSLDLKHYEVNDSHIIYNDMGAKIRLDIRNFQHEGNGDFSMETSELDTYSEAIVSMDYDSITYLNNNKLILDAIFEMDLNSNRYTFKENEAKINQLPLTFDGYVQVNEDSNDMDITFKTPSSDFKNFLAIIPEAYAANIENVETNGDFTVNGRIFGTVDDTHIPKMDVNIASSNASFKYPDLPKSVEDINLNIDVLNETGLEEDTYVNFENMTFRIDQDRFKASGNVKDLTGNMLVDLALNGTINLANLSKVYPVEMEQNLNGILTADVQTNFDMNSIEKEQYQNVNSKGVAAIKNFSYRSPEIPNEVKIASASMQFNQGTVNVPELLITTGQSDIKASGTIQNLMGYLFTDQQLKGKFNVNSNTFSVNDFMVAETEEITTTNDEGIQKTVAKTTGEEAVKIPSFLDAEVAFTVKRLLYDDLELQNAKGNLVIRDETATLQNVSTNIFNGSIGLNGLVSTKNETPVFEMKLNLNSLDIASSFNGLDLMQGLAPIANALQGKLQTNLDLKGNLNNDLTPQLTTLAGNALAQILTAEIDPEKTPLLNKLDSQLDFIDLNDVDLSNLKTQLVFNDGNVEIQPFNFRIKDINVQVSGTHGFDMNMNYNLALDVPAKYLGNQVNSNLAKLSGQKLENTTVKLPIGLTGNFQNPQVNINMQQAVSSLTQQIVDNQKDQLKEKGKDALGNILAGRGINQQGTKPQDSTASDSTRVKTDTTTQQKQIQNAAKEIFGGILKRTQKQKDTTNNDQ